MKLSILLLVIGGVIIGTHAIKNQDAIVPEAAAQEDVTVAELPDEMDNDENLIKHLQTVKTGDKDANGDIITPPPYDTSDARLSPDGHYYLGGGRRRIGAGFHDSGGTNSSGHKSAPDSEHAPAPAPAPASDPASAPATAPAMAPASDPASAPATAPAVAPASDSVPASPTPPPTISTYEGKLYCPAAPADPCACSGPNPAKVKFDGGPYYPWDLPGQSDKKQWMKCITQSDAIDILLNTSDNILGMKAEKQRWFQTFCPVNVTKWCPESCNPQCVSKRTGIPINDIPPEVPVVKNNDLLHSKLLKCEEIMEHQSTCDAVKKLSNTAADKCQGMETHCPTQCHQCCQKGVCCDNFGMMIKCNRLTGKTGYGDIENEGAGGEEDFLEVM